MAKQTNLNENNCNRNKEDVMKWLLIIQSLAPLFFLLVVRMSPFCSMNKYALALCCGSLAWIAISLCTPIWFYFRKQINADGEDTVTEIEIVNAEKSLEFTLTLIIPLLIDVPRTINDVFFFLSLITLVVALLAKSKYWYNNPVLTLEGYKMFWFATKKQGEKRFGISRKEINIGDVITHTNICDSKILYVWRNK